MVKKADETPDDETYDDPWDSWQARCGVGVGSIQQLTENGSKTQPKTRKKKELKVKFGFQNKDYWYYG